MASKKKPEQPASEPLTVEQQIEKKIGKSAVAQLKSVGMWDSFLKKALSQAEAASQESRINALKTAAEQDLTNCASSVQALKDLLQDGGTVTSKWGLTAGKLTHDFLVSIKRAVAGPGRPRRGEERTTFADYQYLAMLIDQGKTEKEIAVLWKERKGIDVKVSNLIWQAQGEQGLGGAKWVRQHWLSWKPGDPDPRPPKSRKGKE